MWRLMRYYRRLYDVVSGLIVRTHVSSFQQLLLSQWVWGNMDNALWSARRYTDINSEGRRTRIHMHFDIQSLVGRGMCITVYYSVTSSSVVVVLSRGRRGRR